MALGVPVSAVLAVTLTLIAGTRPEFLKVGPVAAALRTTGTPFQVLLTGQHTTLLEGCPAADDLTPAMQLPFERHPGWSLQRYETLLTEELKTALRKCGASKVAVQGDTVTAVCGARAADRLGLEVAHIEAGVRSHANEPKPEEVYRIVIDGLANRLYCPTQTCYENIEHTLMPWKTAMVTGNTVTSALARYTTAKPVTTPEPYILITLHRRELYEDPRRFKAIKDQLADSAREHRDFTFIWPVHPATATLVYSGFQRPVNVVLDEPMGYQAFTELLAKCTGVITDSGGLQEEAATLGVPCAVLREATDRPEAIDAGVAKLYGTKPEGVKQAVKDLTNGTIPRRPTTIYGGPDSAANVAKDLASWT